MEGLLAPLDAPHGSFRILSSVGFGQDGAGTIGRRLAETLAAQTMDISLAQHRLIDVGRKRLGGVSPTRLIRTVLALRNLDDDNQQAIVLGYHIENWLAATLLRRTRRKVLFYFLDDWHHYWELQGWLALRLGQYLERSSRSPMRAAGLTPHMSGLAARRGYSSLTLYPRIPDVTGAVEAVESPPYIVFAGSLFDLQIPPLKRLARALTSKGIHLRVYSNYPPGVRKQLSDAGAQCHPWLNDQREYLNVLRKALAGAVCLQAQRGRPEVVLTCLPTKTLDYLAMGLPIVTVCPSTSAVASLVANRGIGLNLGEADTLKFPKNFLETLLHIRSDTAAFDRARRPFTPRGVVQALADWYGGEGEDTPPVA